MCPGLQAAHVGCMCPLRCRAHGPVGLRWCEPLHCRMDVMERNSLAAGIDFSRTGLCSLRLASVAPGVRTMRGAAGSTR